jgi:serine/threonine protein kinase
MDKYSKIKILGRGAFGEAWIVENNETGKKFVMKLINASKVKLDKIHSEINALKKISGEHCGSSSYCFEEWFINYDSKNEPFEFAIVTNFLENAQELTKFMYNLDLPNILFVMQRLLQQLQTFHNVNLTHNDIKPENVIVQFNGDIIKNCLFIDFGLGCLDDNCKYSGTIMYMAPEVLRNLGKLSTLDNLKRADIFSLGIVFYRLLNRKFPYPNVIDFNHFNPETEIDYDSDSSSSDSMSESETSIKRNNERNNYIGSNQFQLYTYYKDNVIPPSNYTNSFLDTNTIRHLNNLVNSMLTINHINRPDINQLIQNFNKINISVVENKYPSNNMLSPNKKLRSFNNADYDLYSNSSSTRSSVSSVSSTTEI